MLEALKQQRPFDGPRSSISRKDAGLLPSEHPYGNASASSIFEGARGDYAATAIYKEGTRYDTYLDPFNYDEAMLIHEALHSATRANDVQLAERIGVKKSSNPLYDSLDAPKKIQQALIDHGCVVKYKAR